MEKYFKYFVAIVFVLISVFLAKAKVETSDNGISISHKVAQPTVTVGAQLANTTQFYNNSVLLFKPTQNLPTSLTNFN